MEIFSSTVLGNLLEIDENQPNICNTNFFLKKLGFVLLRLASKSWSLPLVCFKGAVSRQSSSFCLILPTTLPQSL